MRTAVLADYCQFEVVNITCPDSAILIFHSARFGRMRLGRCVTRDYNDDKGCSASVLDIMDSHCSGRQNCLLPVPRLRETVHPCPPDLVAYLELNYSCIAGCYTFVVF